MFMHPHRDIHNHAPIMQWGAATGLTFQLQEAEAAAADAPAQITLSWAQRPMILREIITNPFNGKLRNRKARQMHSKK